MWQTEEEYRTLPVETVPHPWIRFFARTLDLSIYGLLWAAFSQLILRFNSDNITFGTLIDSFIAYSIMLLLEPLLLSVWGSTPGKWIFGLVVRDRDGNKLSYRNAAARTWGVIGSGCGYGIPIYNLYRHYKSYKLCKEQQSLPWEEGYTYKIKDTKRYRQIFFIVILVLITALTYIVSLQALMPIHRGDITAAEYAENCNGFVRFSGYKLNRTMNEQGHWMEMQDTGRYEISLGSGITPSHTIITEGDQVTGIKIEVELANDKDSFVEGFANQKLIAVMGFLAAQPQMNCFKLQNNNALKQIRKSFENYTDYEAGLRIKNEVEYTGYYLVDDNLLVPNDEEKQYFHMIFTMEKAG
jgi:uncharacterized RDD family membrane protein YckC